MAYSTDPVTEVVEAQGHLIDSHIMERIFDTVVEFQGKFEVDRFQIGRQRPAGGATRRLFEPQLCSRVPRPWSRALVCWEAQGGH